MRAGGAPALARILALAGVLACKAADAAEVRAATEAGKGRHIYLTFDDGPLSGTMEILDIARRMQIPVSMMMIGTQVAADKEAEALFKTAMSDPFTFVGNHSFSHASGKYAKYYSDPAGVLADVDRNQEFLKLCKKVVRLPGRNIWWVCHRLKYDVLSGVSAAKFLADNGYTLIGWDIEWERNPKTGEPVQSVEEMVRDIEDAFKYSFIPGHVVVLAHDDMFRRLSEDSGLLVLLQALKKKSYIFDTLDNYPAGGCGKRRRSGSAGRAGTG